MSDLYQMLTEVRNSIVNAVGQMYLDGKPRNFVAVLRSISEEYSASEFTEELYNMTVSDLFDLGFRFLDQDISDMMLVPAWIYPVIPDGVTLYDLSGNPFIHTQYSTLPLYGDSWVAAGIFPV